MLRKIGLPMLLVLCLLSAAALPGCGRDEGTAETQTPRPAEAKSGERPDASKGSSDEARDTERQHGDANSAKRKPADKNHTVSKSPDTAKKQIEAPAKEKKSAEGGRPPGLSDEEYCELEPDACGPKETPPDRSNPDVRRAEERAEEPDEPVKCDSSDCERARRAAR